MKKQKKAIGQIHSSTGFSWIRIQIGAYSVIFLNCEGYPFVITPGFVLIKVPYLPTRPILAVGY